MNDLLRYSELPEQIITRESIMNFEEYQRVSCEERQGVIVRIAGHQVRVMWDSLQYEWVNYSTLRILNQSLVLKKTGAWSQDDKDLLMYNIYEPMPKLQRILGRGYEAITQMKSKLRRA